MDLDPVRCDSYCFVIPPAGILQQAWNTQLLADPALFGSMVLVALPDGVVGPVQDGALPKTEFQRCYTYESAEIVQNALFYKFSIEVRVHE